MENFLRLCWMFNNNVKCLITINHLHLYVTYLHNLYQIIRRCNSQFHIQYFITIHLRLIKNNILKQYLIVLYFKTKCVLREKVNVAAIATQRQCNWHFVSTCIEQKKKKYEISHNSRAKLHWVKIVSSIVLDADFSIF